MADDFVKDKMFVRRWVVCFALLCARPALAQDAPVTQRESVPWAPVLATSSVMIGAVVAVGVGAWWRDFDIQQFHLKNTGFVGADTYAGGADKFGHFFFSYASLHAAQAVYQSFGVSEEHALMLASGLSLFLGTMIEAVDGFSSYGFEWPDVAANISGLAVGVVTAALPELRDLVGFRLGYVTSNKVLHKDWNYFRTINDYGGMVFTGEFRFSGLEKRWAIPVSGLRYVTVGASYGSLGYNPNTKIFRRNLGCHVSFNLAEIVAQNGNADSLLSKVGTSVFEYWLPPFTSIIVQRDLNHQQTFLNFGVPNRMQVQVGGASDLEPRYLRAQ